MKRIVALVLLLGSLWSTQANAQSGCPSIAYGAVLTAAQWNQCFANKVDYTGSAALTGILANSPVTASTGGWIVTVGLNVGVNFNFTSAQTVNINGTALQAAQTGTVLQLANANGVSTRIEADAYAASAHFSGVRADGTAASPTTLQSGDNIASFNAFGYNGSAFVGPQAAFRCYAAQNWTTGPAYGTYCDLAVTANGGSTLAESVRFENDGGLTLPSTVTGGDKGAGTINAAGLYVNGTAVDVGGVVSTFSAGTTGFTPNSATSGAVTLAGTLVVANGGTNCGSASITCFNNITGFTAAGTTGTTSTNLVFSTSPTLVTPALGAATGTSLALGGATLGGNALAVTGTSALQATTITSASANALAVGLSGATNPAFNVNASTGSQAAGLNVTGAATGGTVAVAAIDSGSNTNLTINAKGSGTIGIGSVSTGAVTITPATTFGAGVTAASLATPSSNIGGALCATSGGVFLYNSGANCYAGGGTAGGSNTQVQYNASGSLGGITGVTSNGTAMTFADGDLILSGSSSGSSALHTSATGGGAITFQAGAHTVASTTLTGQTLSGGAHVTANNIGTVSSGTTTIDCGSSPLQYLTNGGAFTLAAPGADSSCVVYVTNNGSAGTITLSGFSTNSPFGSTYATTNAAVFALSIARVNGTSLAVWTGPL